MTLSKSPRPSSWHRLKALFIDYLLILAWMAAIAIVSLAYYLLADSYPDFLGMLGPFGAQVVFFFVLTFPVGVYLFITESGPLQATVGKQKVGIKVALINGQRPSKSNILIRTIVKLLPWELAHIFIWQMQNVFYQHGYEADVPVWIFIGINAASVLALIYVAMVLWRRDSRGPHDLIAGTIVTQR